VPLLPLKLVEVEDMASDPGKRLFELTHPTGDPEPIFTSADRTQTKVLTRYEREILVPPGDSERITLVYPQSWKVNPETPFIHNCFVPRDPVLVCKIDVQLPKGYSMVLLVNNEEQTPETKGWDVVYRIPMLTASQAIEYVISGPKLLNEHSP
jgi:hypothetical protein